MPKPTQPTSCHGLGRLGGTHPGLLPGFRYLHAYIMTPVARWVGFMQSEDTLQDLQDMSNISRSTVRVVRHGCLSTCTARRMVQRLKSTCLHILPCRMGIAELSCTFYHFYPHPRCSSLRCATREQCLTNLAILLCSGGIRTLLLSTVTSFGELRHAGRSKIRRFFADISNCHAAAETVGQFQEWFQFFYPFSLRHS